jgi:amidase
MADVIAFNESKPDANCSSSARNTWSRPRPSPASDDKAYRAALANNRRYSRAEGIDKILQEQSWTRWSLRPAAWPG